MNGHLFALTLITALTVAGPAAFAQTQPAAPIEVVSVDAVDYQCFVLLANGARNFVAMQRSTPLTDQQKQVQSETAKGLHYFVGRISTVPLAQRRLGVKAAEDQFKAQGQQTPRPSIETLLRTCAGQTLLRTCAGRTTMAFRAFNTGAPPANTPPPTMPPHK